MNQLNNPSRHRGSKGPYLAYSRTESKTLVSYSLSKIDIWNLECSGASCNLHSKDSYVAYQEKEQRSSLWIENSQALLCDCTLTEVQKQEDLHLLDHLQITLQLPFFSHPPMQ